MLAVLADSGMYIEYMYAFSEGNGANVIIKPDNVPNAVEALQAHKIM